MIRCCLFALLLWPLWAREAKVYSYHDSEMEWLWQLNPGQLSSGMETELMIEIKVLDGIEVNLSSELKGGDFRIREVSYLPMRWEKPYWIHEMRALLSTRLPGSYRLPEHTIYLQNGQQARTVTNEEIQVQVHGLFDKKVMAKEDLKTLEELQEKQPHSEGLALSVLAALAALCLWQLYRSSRLPTAPPVLTEFHPRGLEYWEAWLSRQVDIRDEPFQELHRELQYLFDASETIASSQDLRQRWSKLRYAKHRDVQALLGFCRECKSLEQVRV